MWCVVDESDVMSSSYLVAGCIKVGDTDYHMCACRHEVASLSHVLCLAASLSSLSVTCTVGLCEVSRYVTTCCNYGVMYPTAGCDYVGFGNDFLGKLRHLLSVV